DFAFEGWGLVAQRPIKFLASIMNYRDTGPVIRASSEILSAVSVTQFERGAFKEIYFYFRTVPQLKPCREFCSRQGRGGFTGICSSLPPVRFQSFHRHVGLSKNLPTTAPSGRVRMNAAQNRGVREILAGNTSPQSRLA